jgi:cysteine desulfurase
MSHAYDGHVRHYLDHAATSPLRPAAREAWLNASERVGNPSSLHTSGRAARGLVEDARERIAAALGAHPTEVVLTSGGTEADNIGVMGAFWARRDTEPGHTAILTSAVEHHAALDPARWLARHHGADCVEIGVDEHGAIDLAHFADAVAGAAGRVAVASFQWVNNEVGTMQPLVELVELAQRHGFPVHADAVQGVGHMPFDFAGSGLASAAVSAHKVGGPVGIGALLARRDAQLAPIAHGGGQERRLRSGTVDAASAWAFAVALEEAVSDLSAEAARLAAVGERLERAVAAAAANAIVHGPSRPDAAPHIVHAIIPGAPGEALLTALDLAGIDASPGAACTAGVIEPSHVVEAMGYNATAASQTLRLSTGWSTTEADVKALEQALGPAVSAARATRSAG